VTFGRHPNKEIRAALRDAASMGIEVLPKRRGHGWGYVRCPTDGARWYVWSTPRAPDLHAMDLRRFVEEHRHGPGRSVERRVR